MSADKYDAIKEAVNNGTLLDASRKDLERYARTVCLTGFHTRFPAAQGAQIAETVRLMLMVRISETPQTEALAVAKAALAVAAAAVILSCVQALIALGLIPTAESLPTSLKAPPPAVQAPAQQNPAPTAAPAAPSPNATP